MFESILCPGCFSFSWVSFGVGDTHFSERSTLTFILQHRQNEKREANKSLPLLFASYVVHQLLSGWWQIPPERWTIGEKKFLSIRTASEDRWPRRCNWATRGFASSPLASVPYLIIYNNRQRVSTLPMRVT